jgi:hypothetical protein
MRSQGMKSWWTTEQPQNRPRRHSHRTRQYERLQRCAIMKAQPKIIGVRLAIVEKATGLWSLSVTDTVTGLRELPGYRPPTGARRDWPWKAGIQPGRIRPAPSRTTLPTRTRSTEIPQVRGRRATAVTVPQLGPVLNPHGPDLRKQPSSDCREVLSNDVSAGQAMITMCPRADSHLTYMINIALTTEFAITAGGVR